MNILVADRDLVERGFRTRRPWALISISDPERPPPTLPLDSLRAGILRLQFDDAAPGDLSLNRQPPLRLFSASDARAVWQFVAMQMEMVDTLVVQCEAGWSRSPAIAAAISYSMCEDASRFFGEYNPNVFVFRRMLANMTAHLRLERRRRHKPE